MLRITLGFPLGVYHAQSGSSSAEPEWPPNPLRLIGALLAAAHGRHDVDPAPERELLQRLCEAPAPLIFAPESIAVGEPAEAGEVTRLRGATRWAPRNYIGRALSPRNLGRERAEVSKAGVAVGDRRVHLVWPDLVLSDAEVERLALLASDVTFVGTSRSPALVDVATDLPADADAAPWTPIPADRIAGAVVVRVPDERTIADFDSREAARRSDGLKVRPTGLIPQIAIGEGIRYAPPGPGRTPATATCDPHWWGEMIVLAIDRTHSEMVPKAPAAYLLARAVRVALLGCFGEARTPDEAPAILTARGGDPHCAIVPLPNVGAPHGNGDVLAVAIVLPHRQRVADVAEQRSRVELGLRRLLDGGGEAERYVRIPGAGRVQLAVANAGDAQRRTLRESSYRRPSRTWVTVTPIVHSRWRKGGLDALLRQVSADCAHVGLPAPEEVAVLRGAGVRGGADRIVAVRDVPESWRGPLQGPADHLRITFPEPVVGPVLLGRARHFGLGLCVPAPTPADDARAA
jgi:CRISPR-associated protein Csb2